MSLAVALLVGVGGLIGGFAIVLPSVLRPVCPVCMKRTAKLVSRRRGHLKDEDRTLFFEARYRCVACSAELVQRDGGSLVTKGAWDAGMRDALPAARAIQRRPS
jgi:hypothetical protein